MVKRCKGLNSKCFLFTYLVFVSFLLILWLNRIALINADEREIPVQMQAYLQSPPKPITDTVAYFKNKQVLTSELFADKWSFVYFSHENCLPACSPVLAQLVNLQEAFTSQDIQFVVVDLVAHNNNDFTQLAHFMLKNDLQLNTLEADKPAVEQLADDFVALYIQTDYADGSFLIEQEHHIFLVDPKGRLYATFKPPYSELSLQRAFRASRSFYAQTE